MRARPSAQTLPLANLRVLEFGTLLAGPFCTRILADFGAEVIKVEEPRGDPLREWGAVRYQGHGLLWPIQSRNKKCVTLDLRRVEGQELARRLVAQADVVVENFRPGTMEQWKLGYEDLVDVNPQVIMVRVSGYGQTGPYKDRAGFGAAAGAMGGLRFVTGFPDRPPVRMGLSIEDSIAGLQAVIGAMFALYHRDARGGSGQVVDVSLTEAVLALTEGLIAEYAMTGYVRQRQGSTLPGVAPSNIYLSRDGIWLVIAANADNPFRRLFELIGQPAIASDVRFLTNEGRYEARQMLDEQISEWARRHDAAELVKMLDAAGVPSAPIYSAAELVADPHLRSRESIIDVEVPDIGWMPMPGIIPKLLGTPGRIEWTGPRLGEHNEEVFMSLCGLSQAEYSSYRTDGII